MPRVPNRDPIYAGQKPANEGYVTSYVSLVLSYAVQ